MGNFIEIIKERYAIINFLKDAYKNFYKIIMGSQSGQLDAFITKYSVSPIKGVVDGIKNIAPQKCDISSC